MNEVNPSLTPPMEMLMTDNMILMSNCESDIEFIKRYRAAAHAPAEPECSVIEGCIRQSLNMPIDDQPDMQQQPNDSIVHEPDTQQ